MELAQDAQDFLTWLVVEKGRAALTIKSYRSDLLRYQTHLSQRGATLQSADKHDIRSFIKVLQSAGLAPTSLTRNLVAVRGLHRFMVTEALRDDDPSVLVDLPGVPRGLPKALSEGEIVAFLDAVVGNDQVARRDRAILETLYGTGARAAELVGISLGDIDLNDGLVRLLGKGGLERIVPLGRHAAAALEQWLEPAGRAQLEPQQWNRRGDAEAVFLNQRGSRLSRQSLWLIVNHYAEAAGLAGKLTPHVLRHCFATHMLDNGADIRTVQELLGHASISTTQVYTKVANERLLQVYRAAHPRATN